MGRWTPGSPGHVAEHNLIAKERYNVRDALWAGGATGDGVTDDSPAFQAAIDAVAAKSGTVGARITVPHGTYRLGSTLRVRRSCVIEGAHGSGGSGYASTILEPDDGVTAIQLDNQATSTDGGSGAWSIIRDLAIVAKGKTVAGADGIRMYARAKVENVYIDRMSGSGVAVLGGVGKGPSGVNTNANNWRMENVRITNCGDHGVYLNGTDANAGVGIGIDCSSNGGWGIWDSSFLGNVWIGCHASTNGRGTVPSMVSHDGNRYYVIPDSETAASTTEPGTDGTVWGLFGEGGVHSAYPAWVSGNTYRQGGAYRGDSQTGLSGVMLGCYSEGGQPPTDIVAPWVRIGGDHGARFTSRSTAMNMQGNTRGGASFQSGATTQALWEGKIEGELRERVRLRGDGRLTWYDGTSSQQIGYIESAQIWMKSPDGTTYKLAPPNGGGAATWDAV